MKNIQEIIQMPIQLEQFSAGSIESFNPTNQNLMTKYILSRDLNWLLLGPGKYAFKNFNAKHSKYQFVYLFTSITI